MAIDRHDTAEKVISIIAEKLKMEPAEIRDDATLAELGADSLDMVEIIMKLEEELAIEINDEDAETLHNVRSVIDYVHSLRK